MYMDDIHFRGLFFGSQEFDPVNFILKKALL